MTFNDEDKFELWREGIKLPSVIDDSELDPGFKGLDLTLGTAAKEYCEYCLEFGGSVHMCLSGGLDSSLSLAMARKRLPKIKIQTHTIGGSDQHPDLMLAPKIARLYGASSSTIIAHPDAIQRAGVVTKALFGHDVTDGVKGTYLLYRFLKEHGVNAVIAHDGIDELMGGYWEHRCHDKDPEVKRATFVRLWNELEPKHLDPLHVIAEYLDIEILHPYLDPAVVECISRIPLDERTNHAMSKKPLRKIGRRYGLPKEVLTRKKRGMCDILCKE